MSEQEAFNEVCDTHGLDVAKAELVWNACREYMRDKQAEPVAHMFPSDLKEFETNETCAYAYSVAMGNPDEKTVPLYREAPAVAQEPAKYAKYFALADAEGKFIKKNYYSGQLEIYEEKHQVPTSHKETSLVTVFVTKTAPAVAVNEPMASVLAEVAKATAKFPTWPTDPLHAVAVLGEEFGELTKAVLQHIYEPHKSTADDVRIEATQTAAMAIRFLMSLDKYKYTRGEQHSQAAIAAAEAAKKGGV